MAYPTCTLCLTLTGARGGNCWRIGGEVWCWAIRARKRQLPGIAGTDPAKGAAASTSRPYWATCRLAPVRFRSEIGRPSRVTIPDTWLSPGYPHHVDRSELVLVVGALHIGANHVLRPHRSAVLLCHQVPQPAYSVEHGARLP